MARLIRTQIHLGDEELELLDTAARETGASRSELIRRAIKRVYGEGPEPAKFSWVGIVSDGSFDADKIDEELAEIFEERYRRWH
jgi:Ribbon-helix-helix protein, copG family